MYDKEKIYDEQISPLMTQIIKICKDNNIAYTGSFCLKEDKANTEEEGDLMCSTHLPSPEYESNTLTKLFNVLYNRHDTVPSYHAFAMTIKEAK